MSTTTRSMAWMAWLMAALFYAYQYILRVIPSVMMEDTMAQFSIDSTVYGQFSGFYYLGYCAVHLPLGIAFDRYGPKRVMPICILLTVIGTLPLVFSTNWIVLLGSRALIGMGSSAAILGAFKIIRLAFREEHFTRMLSWAVTIGLLGGIYGGGPTNYLCERFGNHATVLALCALGVAFSALSYAVMPKIPPQPSSSLFGGLGEVLRNWRVVGTCLFAGLMVGPMEGFADVWGPEFLKRVYGMNVDVAASLPSMIFVGMCFGAPALGWIAGKTSNIMTIIVSGVVMTLGFAAILSQLLSPALLSATLVAVGVCCAYQILAIYQASTFVREGVAGLTTAITNMVIMSFGYVFHSTIGIVIDRTGGIESSRAFEYGITIIPAALLIGTIGFILIAASCKKASRCEN